MPAVTIRSATAGDIPLLCRLIHGLAAYERLAHECLATEDTLRESLFGEHPGAEVLIAESGGVAAGFALFCHNYSTFLARRGVWLEDLFVDPAHRGQGIGTRLLAALAEIALARGCGRLEWSVLDWNEDAIRFYRGLGAVPMSDWTVHRVTGGALAALAGRGRDSA